MTLPLAQVEAQAIGAWMQVFFYLVAGLGGLLVAWRFFFPHPPEWREHVEAARKEAREGDRELREELEEKTNQLHGRVSKQRDEMQAGLDRVAGVVQASADKMLDSAAQTRADLSGLAKTVEALNQQQIATQDRLARHIERNRD